jgi:hypothetical protein
MFDGLKDRLGSFTEDVEADAETPVEVDDAPASPESDEEPEPEPEPDSDADDGTESDADSSEENGDRGLRERAKLLATGKTSSTRTTSSAT